MLESPYDSFAEDYHWLFPDEHLSGARFKALYRSVLRHLRHGAEVLDCACGAGFEAIAMAGLGYKVTASDASAGMVALARRNLAAAGFSVPVERCSWDRLPSCFERRFEAVFCVGNSIAHTSGPDAMMSAFTGMREVLLPGGLLVVESRDWEKMRIERRRFEVPDRPAVRDGVRGFCIFIWALPPELERAHTAEVIVVLERDERVEHRVVELSFSAYTKEELVRRMTGAGFEQIEAVDGLPRRYIVTGRAPA